MSAFIDASVIVAVIGHESDEDELIARIESMTAPLFYSAMVVYEASLAVARKKSGSGRTSLEAIAEARSIVRAFLTTIDATEIPLVGEIADLALDASGRFGKVVGHPARLNMGDCFAYACARSKGVPLLFKGDDFVKTDIASA
ncbi:type II toxin-antitoxin system VapC family toxin [Methylopila sp. M107]|uniref:type II toxin-antitoxin system VapC family toxin n=1 Tax=Methylopila sp. M107 TaxID=1101190 RepID=UPI00035FFAD4|nr:type II toxin-antitoxin system VapC family toxin [Methylopila sp. M107]